MEIKTPFIGTINDQKGRGPGSLREASLGSAMGETFPAFLERRARETPAGTVCFDRDSDGTTRAVSWIEFLHQVKSLARGLAGIRVQRGDRVGLLLPNGLAWDVAQFGVMWVGGVVVGLDPHAPPRDTAELLQRAGCRGLIIPNVKSIEGWPLGRLSDLSWIITRDMASAPSGLSRVVVPWDSLLERTEFHAPVPVSLARPTDPAALIYTSGTTGRPKGILYSHGQFSLAREILSGLFPGFGPSDLTLSWLPMVNLFQREVNLVAMARGVPYHYVADSREVMGSISRLKPTLLVGVPRFFEKVHQCLLARLPRPAVSLLERILKFTREFRRRRGGRERVSLRERVAYVFLNASVLPLLRKVWGGKLRMVVSGSAPCSVAVLNFFDAIGCPILEAYGLSENLIPLAINRPSDYRLMSVGKVLPGQEVQVRADGEVYVRGPGLCRHDSGEPPAVGEDGFLATKDLGTFDAEGFLHLHGRHSDMIKTANGRRISLSKLEMHFREIPGVDQLVIVGHGRPALVALVTPAGERGDVKRLAEALEKKNAALAPAERLAGVLLLSRPFSVQRGEMTGNLKLRRLEIERNHAAAVEALYEDARKGGWNRNGVIVREG